jgi:outer membrane protein
MRFKATPLAFAIALATVSMPSAGSDLMESYTQARQSDPVLSISELQNSISKEGVVQSRSTLLPQINGRIGINDTETDGTLNDGTDFSSGNTSQNNSLTLNQSIYNYGNYARLAGSKDRSGQSDAELDAANDALIIRVSEAYFNVLTAIDSLAASRAEERAVKRQLDQAEKRLEVGLAPITDVHEAKARYDSSRANTILAGNALIDAREALIEITGAQNIQAIKGLPKDYQPKGEARKPLDQLVDGAMASNPTIQAYQRALDAAEKDIKLAYSGHLPYLDGNAALNQNTLRDGNTGPFSAKDSDTTSYNIVLSIPIFSGLNTQSQVREAVARRDIAADQLEQAKRAVTRQARNADRNLEAGLAEVEARRLAVVSAQSAVEAGEVGLEVGTRTIIDVLLAQQSLFNAVREYSRSRHNYLVNTLKLKQAEGTLAVSDLENINRLLTADAEQKLQQN